MSIPAIQVAEIGKRFRIGSHVRHFDTLGETIAHAVSRGASRIGSLFRPSDRMREIAAREFWALRDISFVVPQGRVLGIIGRNGSGKSTLLKILSKITPPTAGTATIAGRVGSLLEIGTGFHGDLTGRENIILSGTILGMKRTEIKEQFDQIVEFSGVEKFIDTPVKHYSSGMYLRLAFAVAAHLRSEILLIDEVLAVGDAAFQKKCINKMSDVAKQGRTVLFVSHNLGAVTRLCDSAMMLEGGRIAEEGSTAEVVAAYGRRVAADDSLPDEVRLGSVEVRGFSIVSLEGQIQPSSKLVCRFRLIVRRDYWSVFVQLGITTPDGLNLVLDAIDSNRFPEIRQQGNFDVEVSLPPLWLRPQGYSSRIKVITNPERGSTERFYSRWQEITVAGGREIESVSDRILAPRTQWRIHKR